MTDFRKYHKVRILNESGGVADGEYILDAMIVRVKDGLLHDAAGEDGDVLPALETHDGGHVEHWKDGVLHRENGPAVIDAYDGYELWFIDGVEYPPKQ